MARPRLPTARLKLVGAFKKDPKRLAAREGEPEVTAPLGDPPERLNEAYCARWQEIASWCSWLTIADRIQVERVARLWQDWIDGKTTTAQERALDSGLIRLGMTPADRSRVKAPGQKPKPVNAFGALA